jgi:hypothetical protein
MQDTYGKLEVSNEVSIQSVVFAGIIAAELNRRDAIIFALNSGEYTRAASRLFQSMSEDAARMSKDAASMVIPVQVLTV